MTNALKLPTPHHKQKEVLLAKERFIVANCGRRGGKSTVAFLKVLLAAMQHPGNYYIVLPTYKQAKNIYWNDIIKAIIPSAFIHKKDETELSIELNAFQATIKFAGETIKSDNPNGLRSKIFLKGAENPDSLRGVKLRGCVMDEFAFMDNGLEVFKKIIRPALGDQRGWCMFISTPNGIHNDFYDLTKRAKDDDKWFFTHWTAKDNPYFPDDEWLEAEQEHEADGRMDEWNQEWLAKFANPQDLVFSNWDNRVHVFKDPNMIPDETTYGLATDFGWEDPWACAFVQIDKDGNWYVYDEMYETKLETRRGVELIQQKMGGERFTYRVADRQAKQIIKDCRQYGLKLKPALKDPGSLEAGIRLVNGLLHVRESTNKPKLYVYYKCFNTIKEFESYSRKKDRRTGERLETPEDKNNHLMDALRYLALQMKRPVDTYQKVKKEYDPVTGRARKVIR